jgi:hypothetical protein
MAMRSLYMAKRDVNKLEDNTAGGEILFRDRGKIDVLVVHSLTRFSRDARDFHQITAMLSALGLELRSTIEPINETPIGKFIAATFISFGSKLNGAASWCLCYCRQETSTCIYSVEVAWRPVRESNPCRRREREANYCNSRKLSGMGSTLQHSKDSRESLMDV